MTSEAAKKAWVTRRRNAAAQLPPDHRAVVAKQRRTRNRSQVLAHYGAVCACPECDERNPGFLTIDHIATNGANHRKTIGDIDTWLIRNHFPEEAGVQILCWNCNSGRWCNGGICPHLTVPT